MSKSPTAKKSPKKTHKEKNILYNDKISKLEIVLTYNGKTETLFIDNKENISTIKDMVYNTFYPIQGRFQLIYKLKDISPFEDIPLYKYFKNLMKISITINPINAQNNLGRNELNTFNTSLQDVTQIDKNEASFGAANQSQIDNGQNPLVEKDRLICNECHNKIINNFCRNCNLFLCKFCAEKYSSPHHDHLCVNINISQIEKSAKNYKDIVSKECFMTGKKFDEYKVVFKDIINEFNNNENNTNNNINEEKTIKENNDENINNNFNNDINSNLESINRMINQDNEDNNNNEENKNEENKNEENKNEENKNEENKNEENKNEENKNEENKNEENNNNENNNNENNNNENEKNNINENIKDEKNKKEEKKDVDQWLNDVNNKIEILTESLSKNSGANNSESNINIRDEENNYEYLYKKLQKINAEKNKKDLETIFNEMHEIDLNIKNMDKTLDQCLNNSEVNKINGKILKDLNKNLENTINKLVKNLDLNGKIKENAFENNI